ncbi:MAG: hypothetical protein HZA95_00280 [Candidatus Vogelbacteria bacterium]|nr:hypothetical protein [Candidatus Vogelbacteria bacterium]
MDYTKLAQMAAQIRQEVPAEERGAYMKALLARIDRPRIDPVAMSLEQLFEAQVVTRILDGHHEALGLSETQFRAELDPLKRHLDMIDALHPVRVPGHWPFVLVLKTAMSLNAQMSLVVVNNQSGQNRLDCAEVTTTEVIPAGHYLAVDVWDGRDNKNVGISDILAKFKTSERHPGVVEEGLSVVEYDPETLLAVWMDLPGSRCGDGWPYLNLWHDGPRLGACASGRANPICGAVSCGRRLGL